MDDAGTAVPAPGESAADAPSAGWTARRGAPVPGAVPSSGAPVPLALCDVQALAGPSAASAGAVWKLAEAGRQLDANLVRVPPHERIGTHSEPDLDVLLLVIAGHGTLSGTGRAERLAEGVLVWLPRGSTRSITAGAGGLSYLTAHQRRPGMQIRRRPDRAAVPSQTG
jgi:quercetin dioxygenase-like cupin family protein